MQHYPFFLLSFLFSAAPIALAQPTIYTTSRYPVTDVEPGVQVFVLDEAQRIEQMLFPSLADNEQQAEQQVRQRMQRPDWKTTEARLTGAYQALVTAWSLGVEKVPAVVIDERYVVYGTTDTRQARQKLDEWREQPQ
ncbi:TIGR03757 family integrating conjugative element protein [Salmonella enterica]|nr:TIGR03757 family integrating conjugative element protein [Salmonella enterica]